MVLSPSQKPCTHSLNLDSQYPILLHQFCSSFDQSAGENFCVLFLAGPLGSYILFACTLVIFSPSVMSAIFFHSSLCHR